MGVQRGLPARFILVALLIFLAIVLVGCGVDSPQNTFSPVGEVARKQRDLLFLALWPAIVIFVVVEGVLIYALFRFRARKGGELPKQIHGNPRLEIAWTLAPALLLFILAFPIVKGIVDLAKKPPADSLPVNVTGVQWNWLFSYPDYGINTIGELHIPVGRTVKFSLHSNDVIHSFWLPRLGGKLDVIPGRNNEYWLKADEPGDYSGQCAEFCGLGHANMRMHVVVQSETDFQAWVNQQKAAVPSAQPNLALQAPSN